MSNDWVGSGGRVPPQMLILLWHHFCFYRERWWLLLLTLFLPLVLFCLLYTVLWVADDLLSLDKSQVCQAGVRASIMGGPILTTLESPRVEELLSSAACWNDSAPRDSLSRRVWDKEELPLGAAFNLSLHPRFPAPLLNALTGQQILFFPNDNPVAAYIMGQIKVVLRRYQDFLRLMPVAIRPDSNATQGSNATRAQNFVARLLEDLPNGVKPDYVGTNETDFFSLVDFDVRGFKSEDEFKAGIQKLREADDKFSDQLRKLKNGSTGPVHVPIAQFEKKARLRDVWAAVRFEGDGHTTSMKDVSYTFMRLPPSPADPDDKYHHLQDLIDDVIVRNLTNTSGGGWRAVGFREIQSGCQVEQSPKSWQYPMLTLFLSLTTVCSFFLPLCHYLSQTLTEKELRLREYMCIMGVGRVQLQLSWIIFYFLLLLSIAVVIATFIKMLTPFELLENTGFEMIFIPMVLYCMASLAQCYLISTFLHSSKRSSIFLLLVTFVFTFISGFIYRPLKLYSHTLKHAFAFSLMSPVVPLLISQFYVIGWEDRWIGQKWWNLWETPAPLDHYGGTGVAWSFLVADIVLYFLLAIYLERILPGDYGIQQPFYFPFKPSFWFPGRFGKRPSSDDASTEQSDDVDAFEADAPVSGSAVGIDIKGLTMKYGKDRYGIRNLDMNFYQNQVTAFLGQNGAGKSTTMNILVGLASATSGSAKILGMDSKTDVERVRACVGFVPQYDILYPRMTVRQHLKFFGWLKGLRESETAEWAGSLLFKMGLSHALHTRTMDLSGGQKRKLSLITAFMGDPSVVILDEPTSGVDPFSRRSIWSLIQSRRRVATTILSTHFMDEADLLSDRIAIIASGELRAAGTPMYLKNKYGHGFRLILALDPQAKVDKEAISAFFSADDKGGELISEMGHDLTYSFPQSFARSTRMVEFLRDLEKREKELGVLSFGLTDPTMEEIFFTCIGKADAVAQAKEAGTTDAANKTSDQLKFEIRDSYISQIVAVSVKKIVFSLFSPVTYLMQIGLPLIFAILCVLVGESIKNQWESMAAEPVHMWEAFRTNAIFFRAQDDHKELNPFIEHVLAHGFPPRCPCGVEEFSCPVSDAHSERQPDKDPKLRRLLSDPASPAVLDPRAVRDGCRPDQIETKRVRSDPPVPVPAAKDTPPHSSLLRSGDIVYRVSTTQNLPDWMILVNGTKESIVGGFELIHHIGPEDLEKIKTELYSRLGASDMSEESRLALVAELHRTPLGPFLVVWHKAGFRMPVANTLANLRIMAGKVKDANIKANIFRRKYMSTAAERGFMMQMMEQISFFISLTLIAACFGFGVFGIASLLMEETAGGMKRMQMMMGCHPLIYWLVSLFFDCFIYAATSAIIIGFLMCFDNTYSKYMGVITAIAAPFGLMFMAFIYLLSFFFTSSRSLVLFLVVSFFLAQLLAMMTGLFEYQNAVCERRGDSECANGWSKYFNYVFRAFPPFFITEAMVIPAIADMEAALSFGHSELDLYSVPLFGKRIIEAMVVTAVFLAVVLVAEHADFRLAVLFGLPCCRSEPVDVPAPLEAQDPDVEKEAKRVRDTEELEDVLVLRDVKKVYRGASIPAVAGVSVGIPKGQCFGLLGINGAGKSSLFRILTGNVMPTSGTATLSGKLLADSTAFGFRGWERLRQTSYCPQENTLFTTLTVRRHLDLFMKLRGVPWENRRELRECLIAEVGLEEQAGKKAGQLSGGNQRKLQFAIALIGYPSVIFLDEPTSGMDPGARRRTWTAIRRAVAAGSSVVLTSHSMDECENLCDRLVIMVAGSFQCLGSVQYLKGKFGNQYKFKLKLGGASAAAAVRRRVSSAFPLAELVEAHAKTLHYEISATGLRLSELFRVLSEVREVEHVEDFSVSQTTLEHVFVRMALQQEALQARLADTSSAALTTDRTDFSALDIEL